MVTFGEPLKHVITLCGQIWVRRTDDDPPPLPPPPSLPTHPTPHPRVSIQDASVCTFNTFPCTLAPTRTCISTCARGAGTHGDVVNVHTEASWMDTRGFFNVSHHNTTTRHNTPRPQHHTETEREKKTRQDKGREKREDSFSVWWRMAVLS